MFATDGDSVYVTPKTHKQVDFITASMGGTYSKVKNHCKLPRTLGVMTELWNKLPDLRTEAAFMEEGMKLKKEMDDLLSKRSDTMVLEGDNLRPYQRADAEFLATLEAAGIFNEPRTGKTPTALEILRIKRAKLSLVVAPASLLWTWHTQVRQWLPNFTPFVIEGSKNADKIVDQMLKTDGQKVLIVSKNSLNNISLGTFEVAIVDEAHFLRNYQSVQSKAVYKIKAKSRYALTGTPTVKHPSDIFGILKFLQPKKHESFWGWAGRYFREEKNFHSGGAEVGAPIPERQAELQQAVGLISTARKRSEVMSWLPKKAYQVINANMTIKQRKYYDEMRETFIAQCDESGEVLDAQNIMTQMIRLRQLSIDPRLVGFKEKGCKTALLEQYLKDQEEKKPVIIMSMFTSYLELLKVDLEKAGYRVDSITGKMTAKAKQAAANKFQAGETDVLLCNIISAGTGWTLDRGDTVIFIDNAWNPSDQQQAEDRVTPTTQDVTHGHNIVHISTIDSVDQRMFEILGRKKTLTDIINEGGREAILRMIGR